MNKSPFWAENFEEQLAHQPRMTSFGEIRRLHLVQRQWRRFLLGSATWGVPGLNITRLRSIWVEAASGQTDGGRGVI